MRDAVFVHGLQVACRVGVSEAERRLPRRLHLDLEAEVDCRPAAATDDVAFAVDYAALADTARQVAGEREYRLLETLAEALIARILTRFPRVRSVRVRASKRAAVAGAGAVGVELQRQREEPR
ncbi:MAG: dihydroneopterin aldolase [Acidobacteriota bacterium]